MQHNVDTIIRKIKMNANLIPSEIILLLRDMLGRLESLEEMYNGLETTSKTRSGTRGVSKGKVSPGKVSADSDQ